MAPTRTSGRATKKVAPVAATATATKTAASKKRKAAEVEPEPKAAPSKKVKGKHFDVSDLENAIEDIAAAKKPKKTATATAKTTEKTTAKTATKSTAKATATKSTAKATVKTAPKPVAKTPAKATPKTAPKPAPTKVSKPAARKRSTPPRPAPITIAVEPRSTLTDFKDSPPDVSALPVINEAPKEVMTIYVFGTGDMSGDLGLGPDKKTAKLPTVIPKLDPRQEGSYRVVEVACGGMHSLALTVDSKIVTWGGNDEGALGRKTDTEGGLRDMDEKDDDAASVDSDEEPLNPLESIPTHIPEDSFPAGTRFTSVAAGDSCSFAVTATGLVYGWGTFADSEAHKCFLLYKKQKIEKQMTPMLIPGLKNIKKVVCGSNHALALDHDGKVWTWGVSEKLQVGRRLRPENDNADNFYPGVLNLSRNPIIQLSAGAYHSFALDNKDKVYAWGMNNNGQAGYIKNSGADDAQLPNPLPIRTLSKLGLSSIVAGTRQSAAVTKDGRCLVWGKIDVWNGVKLTEEQLNNPKLVMENETGRPGLILQPVEVPGIGEAALVACAATHTIFVNKEGKVFASGYGDQGQLGNKEKEDNKVAEPVMRLDNVKITWAGTGGQWSMVGAPIAQTNGTA